MVANKYEGISITGMASAVSNHWQSLEECVEIYGAEDGFKLDKFKKSTGVNGRWLAGDYQTTSDFCYMAAKTLLESTGGGQEEVGILVFVTQYPDYVLPATACVLHKRLGLKKSCIAFDVNQGCSGFVYGLNIAASLLQTSDSKKALVLCGDTAAKSKSRGRNENRTSHSSLFLFGDSGTATLLEKAAVAEPINIVSCSDGENFRAILTIEGGWRHPWSKQANIMDDIAVFNFAVSEVPDMLNAYMRQQGTTPEDYDKLVLHQANKLIMKQIAKKTGFPMEKVAISLDTFANTSSASIPITLVKEYGEELSDEKKRFLCCGFGVGLSWGAVEINIAPKNILPLIHTDEWFDDGYPEENPEEPYI